MTKSIFRVSILILLLKNCFTIQAQNICADSSYRMMYLFDANGGTFNVNADTAGYNYFTGTLRSGGIGLMKTNWGDSVIWARKIITNNGAVYSNKSLPDGTRVCVGYTGTINTPDGILLCRYNANGQVIWIKKYSSNPVGLTVNGARDIAISNNAIYVTTGSTIGIIITKIDFNGNIIWSTAFKKNLPNQAGTVTLAAVKGGKVYLAGFNRLTTYNPNYSESIGTITILNDADGSFLEALGYRVIPNSLIEGVWSVALNANNDGNFTLTGYILKDFTNTGLVLIPGGGFFSTKLDASLNPLNNFTFTNQDLYARSTNFNTLNQNTWFSESLNNPLTRTYFFTFDNNMQVTRSRILQLLAPYSNMVESIQLDDKKIFIYFIITVG